MRVYFLFIIAVLFLVSCSSGGNIQTTGITFLKNLPPSTLREDQSFQVGFTVVNSYDFDLKGRVCIFDTPSDSFGGIPGRVCEDLFLEKAQGEKKKIPEEKTLYFPSRGGSYSYHDISKGMTSNIVAELFYKNEDRIRKEVCLKKNPALETKGVDCESHESFTSLGSKNVPLKITRLEKSVVPEGSSQRVNVEIVLSNQGRGEVTDSDSLGVDDEESRTVTLTVSFSGTDADFVCTPINEEGKIVFKRNEKVINCNSLITMNQDYYKDNLIVTLEYGYKVITTTGAIPLITKNENE